MLKTVAPILLRSRVKSPKMKSYSNFRHEIKDRSLIMAGVAKAALKIFGIFKHCYELTKLLQIQEIFKRLRRSKIKQHYTNLPNFL